ncbi:MAG: TatD family hydrolase [Candidatus Heimdallarchaeota archaeon]|nr:TatD family hydrolase [Candidatus Heimdallarchaeota archaeon]
MPYFIDAHCHLHPPWFNKEDIADIIDKAKKVNVNKIVNCASDPSQFQFLIDNFVENTMVVTLGMQPTLAEKQTDVEEIRILLNNSENKNKIKAIGEVGLDYHWVKDQALQKRQKILFKNAIELANETQIPLVIHSRKAESDCLDILTKYAQTPVLLHSFEGNLEQITKSIDLGYLISIPTNVVIRRGRRKVAMRAKLDNITLETDSPYCGPSQDLFPNTPANIPIAAKKLSEILETSISEIRTVTTKNAEKFYRL